MGCKFLGSFFGDSVLGLCLAKTARNAARFFLFVFSGCFLSSCLAVFWKVLLGLGCCSNNFCLINCLSPKGFVFGLGMC